LVVGAVSEGLGREERRVTPESIDDLEAEARWLNDWHDRLPAYLYKYASLSGERRDRVATLIRESVLYFSEFRSLNDPFDGLVIHDFTADDETIRQHWRRHWEGQRTRPDPPLDDGIENAVRLAKDPETQRKLGRALLDHNSRDGVYCVTSKPDDLLMWSYYADGHKGLCLRFRTLDLLDNMLSGHTILTPVTYSAEVPMVNFYTSATRDFVQAQIGTKGPHWRHEDEWRFVIRQRFGPIPFLPAALSGVILGCRVSRGDEEYVARIVQAHRPAVPIVKAAIRDGAYGIDVPPM
jgi:hypothetical protein